MPLVIWFTLFLASVFAPMRWGLIAFLCLSTIDFEGGRTTLGSFNILKGIVLPVIMLWRLRAFSGHRGVIAAPVAWMLLVCYAAIGSFWSLFPFAAWKLVGQMTGNFLIACVLIRGTKGGYLTARSAIPVIAIALALAAVRETFYAGWTDDPARLAAFVPAQAFAAFLAALYCIVLCGKGLKISTRVVVCSVLIGALALNGSRIWFTAIVIATLLTLLISEGRVWLKICSISGLIAALVMLVGVSDTILRYVAAGATSNRIAAAITAYHEGDTRSTGLGTFNFRREINQNAVARLKNSSAIQLLAGRGTCNGALITGSLFTRNYRLYSDPNRMFHNEWLRVIYEWGLIGTFLWLLFIGSTIGYTWRGYQLDKAGDAKSLLVYLPGFLVGLAGENIIAGASNPASVGFIFAIALATIPHREFLKRKAQMLQSQSGALGRFAPSGRLGPRWKGPIGPPPILGQVREQT